MKKKWNCFVILLFVVLIANAQIKKRPILPNWVATVGYNINPTIDLDEVVQGNLVLLYDEQIHIDKKETFFHKVTKITENVGVQAASNINITFDPSFQSVAMHTLHVIRDGKVIDKLKSSDFQILRRETNSENYIYDGTLSAFTNISDVRSGDIIEYSYTVKGFNPIHGKKFASIFNVESSQPLGKIFVQLKTRKPLGFKYFKTDFEFKKTVKNRELIYTLSEENRKGHTFEEGTPIWYIPSGLIHVSNYESWEEVLHWGIKLFQVKGQLSSALQEKIKEIEVNHEEEGEKIVAALNFVQNDIRYLGLEIGIGAYQPFSPNKVFAQRYGDCKDKSLLLVTMLNKMGIEAYPVLVNSYLKETVKELLPSAKIFDHCVVKVIDKYKKSFWYDPTISNQGGRYYNIAFPDYRYGLVLGGENTSLEEIDPLESNLVEVTSDFVLEEEGSGATLKIVSVFHASEADYMRSFFKNNGISSIQDTYEKYHAKRYPTLQRTKAFSYDDDKKGNVFTLYENYKIDSLWKPSINPGQIVAEFYPYTISELLSMPTKMDRKTPFALYYPASRNHAISIKVPEDWSFVPDNFAIRSPNINYERYIYQDKSESTVTIDHIFKTQKDYVAPEEFSNFVNDLKRLESQMSYNLIVSENGSLVSNLPSKPINWLRLIGVIIYFVLVGIFLWLGRKLYFFNPIPKIESYYEANKKIEGWLIVIGVALVISILKILVDLFFSNVYISGKWLLYFLSDNVNFHLGIGVLLILETVLSALQLVYYPLITILFFKRRSSFPKIHSIFLVGYFIIIVLDYLLAISFSNRDALNIEMNMLLIIFIHVALVVPYLWSSDSVKETFVQTLKKKH